MLTKRKITVFLIILTAVIFLLPDLVSAQTVSNFGVNDLVDTGLGTRDIRETIALIINVILGFLGILATLIIIYAGWTWMTSQGEADKIEKAKKTIVSAVIGLVIILASYGIARFILKQISDATGYDGPGSGGGYVGGVGIGGGIIESHYPARNATDVPRNTNIYITFKEPMNLDDLTTAVDCDFDLCAKVDNLILTDRTNSTVFDNTKLKVIVSADHKVFAFNPYDTDAGLHLGNANGETEYNFALSNNIHKENGDLAFGLNGYDWDFTISNEIDLTPPTVTSVIPVASSVNPRNTVVQVNFSEAVNPMLASGVYPDFTNLTTKNSTATIISGQYLISNQYQTVEFLTNDLCGTNSCGGDVYCLPANESLTSEVTDLIKDMADNQLDGNGDGIAGGNYIWSFSTNDTIDLSPPEISSMQSVSDVDLSAPVQVSFNKNLLTSSVNSEHVKLVKTPATAINYWLNVVSGKAIRISHDKFDSLTQYKPTLLSGIQDVYQNCWYPCACDDPTGHSCACDTDFSLECASGLHCEEN
ncbi:Ig-like domain-containing protein [Candidatus Nomurabacteria bacterium]|nr:Ig-like domain-containing protein [Candidatus Nomurabacteria bacterium]